MFSRIIKYCNRRMAVIIALGFSSGLPLALVGGSLHAWFKQSGAGIVFIGYLSLLMQPYSYKFLWAPLFDYFKFSKNFDQKKGWIFVFQALLIASIFLMSLFSPMDRPAALLVMAFLVSFFSASQDIVVDGYRAVIFPKDELGLGTAVFVEGYRLAMIVSGAGVLALADKYGWMIAYQVMAILMSVGVIATCFAPSAASDVDNENIASKNISFWHNTKNIFINLLSREKIILLLGLIVFYKLGDAFSHALTTPFLMDLGFNLTEIASMVKLMAVIATIIGVFVGGIIMTRINLYSSLLFFGVLQAVTNLSYMLLAIVGKNYHLAFSSLFIENLCAGMGTAAYVSLMLALCNKKFSGTQYAMLSSIASLGRIYVGPISGHMVDVYGWSNFYLFSALAAIPGLFLLYLLRHHVTNINNKNNLKSNDQEHIDADNLTKPIVN